MIAANDAYMLFVVPLLTKWQIIQIRMCRRVLFNIFVYFYGRILNSILKF